MRGLSFRAPAVDGYFRARDKPQKNTHAAPLMTPEWKVAKTYTDILYHKAGGIAKVTINRPEKRNAFRPLTVAEMHDAFADAR